MQWDDFTGSGFARWYALATRGERTDGDGRRTITLRSLGHGDRVVVDVVVEPTDAIASVTVHLTTEWLTRDSTTNALAIDFVASLLRMLEPGDALVRALTTRLRARIGLAFDDESDHDDVALDAITHALDGRLDAVRVTLDGTRTLEVHHAPDEITIAWSPALLRAR